MGAIGGDELMQWEKAQEDGVGGGGVVVVGGNANGKEERITVSVRLRPLNAKEMARNDPSDWECINDTTIIFRNSLPERSMFPTAYTFDRVFQYDSTTKQVYDEGAKEVALSVVSGINSSIFAYGQTSSGKTYTMTGITEYAVADIYDYIQRHEERAFVLKFSAMEIYNEAVKDLLSTDITPLRLLDDPDRGTVVDKLTEETLRDWNHLKELLSVCEAQRQIGETSLNETSSRSHQILRLTIESAAREFLGKDNSSSLAASVNFVDLAGSERSSQASSAGMRLKEGCHINRSLLTLGTVIRKLSKGRNGHIPYRDSKLTRILQPSLGGNARTAIICTMSPARSHVEQSRNTLLFASCAKEVVTSAQVNVVMSDKALVKRLQKELARLESELRCPGPISSISYSVELLKEKDAQIQKMEKEIKELIQQRGLAQSRLEDLLRAVEDHQALRQWEDFIQTPTSHAPNACEDGFSISESSGVLDSGFTKSNTSEDSAHVIINCNETYLQLLDKPNQHDSTSPRNSVSCPSSVGLGSNEGGEDVAQANCEDPVDLCKEVRCIEMDERTTSRSEQSNDLLTEGSDCLLPFTVFAGNHGDQEFILKIEGDTVSGAKKTIDRLVKQCPDELSPWASIQTLSSSRSLGLTRSRSCRAILTSISTSPWLLEEEQNENTPPSRFLNDFPGRPERFQRRNFSLNFNGKIEVPSEEGSQTSERGKSADGLKAQNIQTEAEEDISGICNFVGGLKEMAQIKYQKQLTDGQFQEVAQKANEDVEVEESVRDVGLDPMLKLNPMESPSHLPLEFEKQLQEIIELWQACNVSLVHRTCFFLLFKGDPTDSVYLEVELRRLSFLSRMFSDRNLDKSMVEDGRDVTLASSTKALRREREMLCRRMQKRLSAEERLCLYRKWEIALDSKQRRLQLARLLWSETKDKEHIRESASIIAKLIGLLEPGEALKEMFGLSFAPLQINQRSYSWKHGMSSLM